MQLNQTRVLLRSFTLILALSANSVFADDAGTLSEVARNFLVDPSRDLTRLSYYPHPGKLYLVPSLQYVPTDLSLPSNAVRALNDTNTRYWQITLNAIYGLPLDGLRFGITESDEIHRWNDTTNATSGFVSQTDSAGLSDPTFEIQYRYFDSKPLGFAGDIDLSASPSWVTDDSATSSAGGSNGKGYGTMTLSTTQYEIFSMLDLGLTEAVTRNFSGNGINPTTATSSYNRDSNWVFTLAPTGRLHFTPDLYVQASAAFDFSYSYNQTNSAQPPVTTNYQYPFHVNPSLLLGYRVFENFVMDATYTYQNYTRNSMSTPPTTSTFTLINTLDLRARIEI